MNLSAVANSPTEARTNLSDDHFRLGEVIKDAGVKLE
jgi:hypothetical protein